MKVTLLLHLHQPLYWIPRKNQKPLALLPWTFLHGIGEYYDLARTLLEAPAGRVTVNLSPVLLDQWEAYRNRRVEDVFLQHVMRSAEDLTPAERAFVARHFFAAHPLTQIGRFPRYRELQQQDPGTWTPQEYRDLQVLFVLAYTAEIARREDPVLQELVQKGRNFTEEDKQNLLAAARRLLDQVPALYQALARNPRLEISLSPYFHPILPLLIRGEAHREAGGRGQPVPGIAWPEDALRHLQAAHRRGADFFGQKAFGLWPSEGSVSEEALNLVREAGFQWAATDQQVLARSRPGALPYRLYTCCNLPVVFRDTELSDRIGFVYGAMKPREAAEDLVQRLRQRAQAGARFVALILDGENPWPNYQYGGMTFLREVLQAVDQAPDLAWATVGDLVREEPATPLSHLAPGSWIHGTFDTWMGHPEKRQAWRVLRDARARLIAHLPGEFRYPPTTPEHSALYAFMAAEGSDWFWWLGDDHPTPLAPVFDRIFRELLRSAFEHLDLTPPAFLDRPLKQAPAPGVQRPRSRIRPRLDGRESHYLEWRNAGRLWIHLQPAMAGEPLHALYYGFDEDRLYLRLDFSRPCREVLQHGQVRVQFKTPEGVLEVAPENLEPAAWACDEVLEFAVPWPQPRPQRLEMAVELTLDNARYRYPATGWVALDLSTDWMV